MSGSSALPFGGSPRNECIVGLAFRKGAPAMCGSSASPSGGSPRNVWIVGLAFRRESPQCVDRRPCLSEGAPAFMRGEERFSAPEGVSLAINAL
jgi:hypothetical protein